MENIKPMYEIDFEKVGHNKNVEYYIRTHLEMLEELLPNKSYIKLSFKFLGVRRISGRMEIRTKEKIFIGNAISYDLIECFDDLQIIILDQVNTWKRNRFFSYAM